MLISRVGYRFDISFLFFLAPRSVKNLVLRHYVTPMLHRYATTECNDALVFFKKGVNRNKSFRRLGFEFTTVVSV